MTLFVKRFIIFVQRIGGDFMIAQDCAKNEIKELEETAKLLLTLDRSSLILIQSGIKLLSSRQSIEDEESKEKV